jgi:hypothetical protein
MPLPPIRKWTECMHVIKLRAPNPDAQRLAEASITVSTPKVQALLVLEMMPLLEGWDSVFGRDVKQYLRGVAAKQ